MLVPGTEELVEKDENASNQGKLHEPCYKLPLLAVVQGGVSKIQLSLPHFEEQLIAETP
jgi:hypothetical protein